MGQMKEMPPLNLPVVRLSISDRKMDLRMTGLGVPKTERAAIVEMSAWKKQEKNRFQAFRL